MEKLVDKSFIDQKINDKLVEDLLEKFNCDKFRIVSTSHMISMEHIPDRLTIMIDADQKIKRIWNS
jgi:hypothetical protein